MARKRKEMFRIDAAARRDLRLLIVVLAAALMIVGLIYVVLHGYVKSHDDGTILNGVSIGSLDVSGMTEKEAKKALEDQVIEYNKKTITFDLGEKRSIDATLEELGFTMANIDEAVDEAYKLGHQGSVANTFKLVSKSKKGQLTYYISPVYKLTTDTATNLLKLRETTVLATPENACWVPDGESSKIQAGKDGEDIDIDATLETLEKFLNKEWKGDDGKITATVNINSPEISEEDLKSMSDLLATYTTYYNTGGNSAINIETAARHMNGIYMQPGEEVSATTRMVPFTEENGYVAAKSYSGDVIYESIGGGICQVSTTLYNALILAELEVTERHSHTMPITYVPLSMDAAMDEGVLDLKFKNGLNDPVYIQSIVGDGILTFNIYGVETRPANRTIAFETEIVYEEPCNEVKYEELEDYVIGYTTVTLNSSNEISAKLWKIVYVDGIEQSRDIFNTSYYAPRAQTIGIGTYSETYPQAMSEIKAAIEAEDGTKIYSIISEVENETYGKTEEEKKAEEEKKKQEGQQ